MSTPEVATKELEWTASRVEQDAGTCGTHITIYSFVHYNRAGCVHVGCQGMRNTATDASMNICKHIFD